MLKEIERNLNQLGVKLNGSINVELDLNNKNKVNVYDMDIMTFEKINRRHYFINSDALVMVKVYQFQQSRIKTHFTCSHGQNCPSLLIKFAETRNIFGTVNHHLANSSLIAPIPLVHRFPFSFLQ